MILNLVDKTDPILYKPTEDIDFDNPQIDPVQLFNDLKDTLISLGGLGLSANQVGISYSCFVIGDTRDPDGILGIFNPKILTVSDKDIYMDEGCLSFPHLLIKIKRPTEVRFRAANCDGKIDTTLFSGLSARIFLHEFDHLNGTVFTKRANLYYLEKAKKLSAKYSKQKSVQ